MVKIIYKYYIMNNKNNNQRASDSYREETVNAES